MDPATASTRDLYINVCLIGPSDSGKTSVGGWIIRHLDKRCDARTVMKLDNDAAMQGKRGVTWHLDRLKREREQGSTVYGNITNIITATHRKYCLLDPPGNKKWEQRLVRFLCQADAVIFTINAKEPFVPLYTSRIVTLFSYAYMFSVRQVIVAVTGMKDVHYNQQIFEDIKEKATQKLISIGFKRDNIIAILPVCTLEGANVAPKHPLTEKLMPWWTGPSLGEALEKLHMPPRDINGPALIVYSKAYRIGGVGTVVVGGILKGTLNADDVLMTVPGIIKRKATSIECWHRPVQQAFAGDIVGIHLRHMSAKSFIKHFRGFLVAAKNNSAVNVTWADWKVDVNRYYPDPSDAPYFDVPRFATTVIADILFVKVQLGKHRTQLAYNTPVAIISRLATVRARIRQFVALLNKKNFAVEQYLPDPDSLQKGDLVRVELHIQEPLPVEEHSRIPALSKIILADTTSIVGAGVVRTLKQSRIPVRALGHGESGIVPTYPFRRDIQSKFDYTFEYLNEVIPLSENILRSKINLLALDCSKKYSEEDVEAIKKFVHAGGTLVLNVNNVTNAKTMPLLSTLGIVVAEIKHLQKDLMLPVMTSAMRAYQMGYAKKGQQISKGEHYTTYARWLKYALKNTQVRSSKSRSASMGSHKPWTKADASSAATPVREFSAWLPIEIWIHVFSFLDAYDVCSCQAVCKDMRAAAEDDYLWRQICAREGFHILPKAKLTYRDIEMANKSIHKWQFQSYMASTRKEGGTLIKGPYGNVNYIALSPHPKSGYLVGMILKTTNAAKHKGAPLSVLPKNLGGLVAMIHYPRYQLHGKGQILVMLEGQYSNFKGNQKLLLNLLHDASVYCFSPDKN